MHGNDIVFFASFCQIVSKWPTLSHLMGFNNKDTSSTYGGMTGSTYFYEPCFNKETQNHFERASSKTQPF